MDGKSQNRKSQKRKREDNYNNQLTLNDFFDNNHNKINENKNKKMKISNENDLNNNNLEIKLIVNNQINEESKII